MPVPPSGLLESLFQHSVDGVLLGRKGGAILRANPAACRALRLAEEEILARGRAGLVVDDDDLASRLRERTEAGATTGLLSFRRGDGTTFVAEITSGLIPGSGPDPASYTIFRDVTDRLLAEQAIRESEERFRVAFQTSPDSVNLNRLADGGYLSVNEGFTRLTGWTAEEVVGRTSAEIGIWADAADRERLVAGLRRDGFVENMEARFRRKDGTSALGLMSARLVRLNGEEIVLTITRDIGEWRRAEEERKRLQAGLDQSARMSAIGQLAGGVAHDFNNLLTVVLSCIESLRIDSEAGRAADKEDVDEIRGAAERARDLTRQLLTFARRQFIQPEVLDLNEVVRGSEKLLRRVLGEVVELRVALATELWPARFDRGQMEQVIMNLAVNARDAMPAGGTLVLETTNLAVHGGSVPDGAYVALRVRDTGTGLSPEARAHLFEPFFTTKARGKGTGLGLATVYGIVKQNLGEIHVESEPGRGTAFEILLPRSLEAPASAPRPPLAGPARGSETVLLVEDEPRLRDLLARSLREAGYRVIAAGGGREALDLGPEAIEQSGILVTDLVMPGLDGRSTADALRRRHPSLPVLFISGYSQEDGRPGELNAITGFLSKPFTPGDLLGRIRGLLDGVAERGRPSVPEASRAAWRPELATGIREVDMQHRELLVRIAALERAALAGDLLQADDALAYLDRYAAEHFATEENLMRGLGYPLLEAHRSLHAEFASQLGRRKAAYAEDRSQATLLVELARWMEGWLGDHVLGADAEMARFVRSRGRLPVPGRAGVDVDEVLRPVEPDAT